MEAGSDQPFGERLQKARKKAGLSQEQAARELSERGVDVSSRSIGGYERGEFEPDDEFKKKAILEVIEGIAYSDLQSGAFHVSPWKGQQGRYLAGRDPIYGTAGSARPGTDAEDTDAGGRIGGHVIGYVDGPEAMSRPGREIFWVYVQGDSMGETYRKHSVVPCLKFEEAAGDIREDDVYVFRLEGAVQIKRLQRLPGQRIRIKSDNPHYDDVEIAVDDGLDFEVLGRVLF